MIKRWLKNLLGCKPISYIELTVVQESKQEPTESLEQGQEQKEFIRRALELKVEIPDTFLFIDKTHKP